MRFTASKNDLTGLLAWVARALPAKPTNPVLTGVKLVVADGTVTASAFDFEQSASATLIDAEDTTDGEMIVNGRLLASIVKALPAGPVTFTESGGSVLVKSGSSKFTLMGLPVAEYPALPELPAVLGAVEPSVFATAVRRVVVAAGREDSLPTLTGTHVEVDPMLGVVTLVATDRYRLAVHTVSFDPADGAAECNLLVPAKVLKDVAGASSAAADLSFGSSGQPGLFSVDTGDRTATTRLIDGEFPKWRRLIPDETPNVALVDAGVLIEAVKRAQLVTEANSPIRLTFSTDDGLSIESGSASDASAVEQVDADYEGETLTIAFNANYLLDGLGSLGGTTVRIGLQSSQKPALLHDADDETQAFTYLLMPVRS